jgi:hypothetical protein
MSCSTARALTGPPVAHESNRRQDRADESSVKVGQRKPGRGNDHPEETGPHRSIDRREKRQEIER